MDSVSDINIDGLLIKMKDGTYYQGYVIFFRNSDDDDVRGMRMLHWDANIDEWRWFYFVSKLWLRKNEDLRQWYTVDNGEKSNEV